MEPFPAKMMGRGLVLVAVSLTGTGAAAPTVDTGANSQVFISVTRTGAGRIRLTMKRRHVAVKILGWCYSKSDFDTTPLYRKVSVRGSDTLAATPYIDLAIADDDSAGTNAAVDLGVTEKIELLMAFDRAART